MAAGRSFMRENAGKRPDRRQFFELFVASWTKAASVETAQSGFRDTEMFPVNKNAVPQHVFEPSQTSDQPLQAQGKLFCSLQADVGSKCLINQISRAGISISSSSALTNCRGYISMPVPMAFSASSTDQLLGKGQLH